MVQVRTLLSYRFPIKIIVFYEGHPPQGLSDARRVREVISDF
jgi:hypothetical protein